MRSFRLHPDLPAPTDIRIKTNRPHQGKALTERFNLNKRHAKPWQPLDPPVAAFFAANGETPADTGGANGGGPGGPGPNDGPGGPGGGPPEDPNLRVRKRHRRVLRVLAITLLVLLVLSGSFVTWLWQRTIGRMNIVDSVQDTLPSEIQAIPTESLANPVPKMNKVINILLLGIDSREKDRIDARSDTMMVLTINEMERKVKLMSLQRDMLVYIPSRPMNKINAANVFGGPQLAMRVVNESLRLGIDKYAVVNLAGMEAIIDAVGGVEIDVAADLIEVTNRVIWGQDVELEKEVRTPFIERAGVQMLNGAQALAYSRNRATGNYEYDRMSRQREVLQALMTRFNQVDAFKKLNLISTGLSYVTTNLSRTEIVSLATKILPLMNESIDELQIPIEGYHREYMATRWVNLCDFNAMIPLVQDFIFGKRFPFDPVKVIPGAPNSNLAPTDGLNTNKNTAYTVPGNYAPTPPPSLRPSPAVTRSQATPAPGRVTTPPVTRPGGTPAATSKKTGRTTVGTSRASRTAETSAPSRLPSATPTPSLEPTPTPTPAATTPPTSRPTPTPRTPEPTAPPLPTSGTQPAVTTKADPTSAPTKAPTSAATSGAPATKPPATKPAPTAEPTPQPESAGS